LTIDDFSVDVSCASGYKGSAAAAACANDEESYSLSGCEKVPDNYVCIAPDVSKGYIITESDLRLNSFTVTATCAPGYTGTAKVRPCSGSKEVSVYKLRGCTAR